MHETYDMYFVFFPSTNYLFILLAPVDYQFILIICFDLSYEENNSIIISDYSSAVKTCEHKQEQMPAWYSEKTQKYPGSEGIKYVNPMALKMTQSYQWICAARIYNHVKKHEDLFTKIVNCY